MLDDKPLGQISVNSVHKAQFEENTLADGNIWADHNPKTKISCKIAACF